MMCCMTKVKVDVQILITGPTGSGKGLVMNRIREFLSKQVSNGITQKHSFQNYFADGVTFELAGELLQHSGPKAPKRNTHTDIPGYPDADKMLDYLVAKVNETALSETLKDPKAHAEGLELLNACVQSKDTEVNVFINQPKTQTLKVFVDPITGIFRKVWEGEKINEACVVTLLTAATADAPTDPVGMDQVEPQTACAQVSGHEPMQRYAHLVNGRVVPDDIGEFVRFDEVQAKTIILTKAELQSKLSRVKWAEGLIRQLPKDHDGRNSWLKNYGQVPETETCAPEDHAHDKAYDTLYSLRDELRGNFKEHSLVDGSVLKGDHWVIFDNGHLVSVSNWVYCADIESDKPVYYTER